MSITRRLALAALALPLPALAAPADPVEAYQRQAEADQRAASDRRVSANASALLSDAGSPVLGAADGDVTIVQFYDYNCRFTRAVQPRIEALLKADPKVKLVLKPFPIEPAATSVMAARAALAASKQRKLEAFHQAMLINNGRALTAQAIFDLAGQAGLDVGRLRGDMDAPDAHEQVIKNFNLARALRVFETPTFIIGGRIVTDPSARIDFPAVVAAVRARPA